MMTEAVATLPRGGPTSKEEDNTSSRTGRTSIASTTNSRRRKEAMMLVRQGEEEKKDENDGNATTTLTCSGATDSVTRPSSPSPLLMEEATTTVVTPPESPAAFSFHSSWQQPPQSQSQVQQYSFHKQDKEEEKKEEEVDELSALEAAHPVTTDLRSAFQQDNSTQSSSRRVRIQSPTRSPDAKHKFLVDISLADDTVDFDDSEVTMGDPDASKLLLDLTHKHKNDDKNNHENNNDDTASETDSEDWEQYKQRRQGERRLGCVMFLLGLAGVIIAIVLVVKEQNKDKTQQSQRDQLIALLELPTATVGKLKPATISLTSSTTPQSQAFAWLKSDPNWQIYNRNQARQRFGLATLYYATKGDKWNFPNDIATNNFLSYNVHECDWMPASDHYDNHDAIHLGCNHELQLTSLNLRKVNLHGQLPPEVLSVMAPETLRHFDLSHNHLHGSLPSEIGLCQNLTSFTMSYNSKLDTTIPTEMGVCTNLHAIRWIESGVKGSIPTELGLLKQLEELEWSDNQLSGPIPGELFHARIREVRLGNNELQGTVSSKIALAYASLETLVVSDNRLETTTLPTILASLAKLTHLQMGGNPWTGDIPKEWSRLTALKLLGLNDANLQGTIPTELLKLSTLQSLYLHNNPQLGGTMGSDESSLSFTKLPSLRELTLDNTTVSGILPNEICDIPLLSFDCNANTLCGCDCQCKAGKPAPSPKPTLRPTVVTLKPTEQPTDVVTIPNNPTASPTLAQEYAHAAFLDLLPNWAIVNLESLGKGPQSQAMTWLFDDPNFPMYSDFQKVQRYAMATLYFSLYTNQDGSIKGEISSLLQYDRHECDWFTPLLAETKAYATCREAYALTNRLKVRKEDRQLVGLYLFPTTTESQRSTLPREVGLLSSMESLRSNRGNLTGTLPSELGLLTNLQELDIADNKLSGTIPSDIGKCTSLMILKLASNQNLNGTLPAELASLSKLEELSLSQNDFDGELLTALPTSLQHLDLSNNRLWGTVPLADWVHFEANHTLKSLILHHNKLYGSIETQIGKMRDLSAVDLSYCRLAGDLPSEIGMLAHLKTFDVSWNQFNNTIPTQLGELKALSSLDLHYNDLRGTIPSELSHLTRLKELRLHGNAMIYGHIPEGISSLPDLRVLTVNLTFVSGFLPERLCALEHFNYSCSPTWLCGCSDCLCG